VYYIEKWGKPRLKPLVVFAQTLAVMADPLYHLLRLARERKYEELTANVTDEERLHELYANPSHAFWGAGAALHSTELTPDELDKARLAAPDVNKILEAELERATEQAKLQFAEKVKSLKTKQEPEPPDDTFYFKHLKWLQAFIANDDEVPHNAEELLRIPEVIFLLRVLMPCWLEYGQTPDELLNQAKNGDLSAMKNLMRLDERFLEVPALRELFYSQKNSLPEKGQEAFVLALSEEPEKNLTPQRIRTILAALILNLSNSFTDGFERIMQTFMEQMIYPQIPAQYLSKIKKKTKRLWGSKRKMYAFDTTDIRELFDAVAKDTQNKRNARDTFIARNDHAFYMGIKREDGFWQSIAPVSLK